MTKFIKLNSRLKESFVKDHVIYKGVVLPLPGKRYMGEFYRDDGNYYASMLSEADRLLTRLQVNKDTRLAEIGSSTGRTIIGLLQKIKSIKEYVGIDISLNNINWCIKHIGKNHGFCRFVHIDLNHPMYNPKGFVMFDENFAYPLPDDHFDIVYLNSVLPNLLDSEVKILCREFFRILKNGGRLFVTAFVEENVPDCEENPENYIKILTYPRHIVRFNKEYFIKIFTDVGFEPDSFEHGTEIDFQSAAYFTKPS